MPRAVISAAIDIEVARRVVEEARKRGLRVSSVVNEALSYWVNRAEDERSTRKSGRVVTLTSQDQFATRKE